MLRLLLVAIALLAPVFAFAGEISDFDIATYSLTGKDGQPSGMQMRLSRPDGKWVMEGKKDPSSPWKNISCDSGCEYRASIISEQEAYLASFPSDMQKQFDIACIQNMANAFCRLTMKNDASKGDYALVALVTGRPAPMSLQRLTRPYPSNPLEEAEAAKSMERVNRIVESVRKATSIGFIDVTIDYTEPNLYISGHTYSNAHVYRLMRSVPSKLKLVEIKPQNVEDLSAIAFQLVDSDVGNIRKWSGPIILKFPRTENLAEIYGDMLRVYSLNDFVYIAVIGKGQQKRAIIRSPDGKLYHLREGHYIGIEQALVSEINENSIIFLERTGTKRELKIFQQR